MADKKAKNLFIDANIWLSLFHFTSDDLAQFKKLKALLGSDLRLFVPEQIYNEVYRNRENKIKDALDKFEKLDLQFPNFFKNYDEYETISQQYSELKKQHSAWLSRVKRDIASQSTPADIVLNDFFISVDIIPSTPELIEKGVARFNSGNPPGKDKKYGDAINWETLLASVPDGEDLFFVSSDKDYASIFDTKQFHPFLSKEWQEKKHSKIIFFKSLAEFINTHVKEIQLRAESEKDELIDELTHSNSFKTTHRVINDLSKFTDWSLRQIQDMCSAAISNQQISWILADADVFSFYQKLLDIKSAQASPDEAISTIRQRIKDISSEQSSDSSPEDLSSWWEF